MLLATGHVSAAFSRMVFSLSVKFLSSMVMARFIAETLLGSDAIIFSISASIFPKVMFFDSAEMPISVIIQDASEVHNKSVGEKASPRP